MTTVRDVSADHRLPGTGAVSGMCGHGTGPAVTPDANGSDQQTSRFPVLIPRQLPPAPLELVGRDAEVAALDEILTAVPTRSPATVVLSGPLGAGRTALAAWWLHQQEFPGGQLYAQLDGPHGPGETPREVLGRWLRAIGVPPPWVPAATTDRIRLWREVTSGRHLAVLIDDATSAASVTALRPGTGPGVAVVTSRRPLGGAPSIDFAQVKVSPLKRRAAAELLSQHLEGAAARAARELAAMCGGLPVASRCAARLADGCQVPARLAAQLEDEKARLIGHGFPRAEATTRAVIAAAVARLDAPVARALRLLALSPGPEVSPALAAAILSASRAHAGAVLDTLAAAGLIDQPDLSRCQFHPLIQAYAREHAEQVFSPAERRKVTGRILAWYAAEVTTACTTLAGPSGHDQASTAAVAGWLDRNQPAMITALATAAAHRDHAGAALRLAGALWPLLRRRGCDDGQLTVARLGIRAACTCGDERSEARMRTRAGVALARLGQPHKAPGQLHRAATLWRRVGDDAQLAVTLRQHGQVMMTLGRPAQAVRLCTAALMLQRDGWERDTGLILISLGQALTAAGRDTEAVTRLRQARPILCAQPDFRDQALAQAAFGAALAQSPEQAIAHLEHALTTMHTLGCLPGQVTVVAALGGLAARTGQPSEARRRYQHILAMLPSTHPAAQQIRRRLNAVAGPWPSLAFCQAGHTMSGTAPCQPARPIR